jgi:hypothetical protein
VSLTPGQLTTPHAARAFLLGGHAVVTLVSRKTGTRFTYRVSRAPEKREKSEGIAYFVSVLNGPENTSDYAYIGLLVFDHGPQDEPKFCWTRKSRVTDLAPSFKAFRWAMRAFFFRDELFENLEVWHSGACGKCGRPLTVPESIASGLGPVCASK